MLSNKPRLSTIALFLFIGTAGLNSAVHCAEDMQVLSGKIADGPANHMMRRYLRSLVATAVDKRRERYENVKNPAQAATYKEQLRESFLASLDGFPERTPLNARVVARGNGQGYRYEQILFESQPQFYVSAILYLPESKPPYPGVLVPCGHSESGKAEAAYQRACILLARNGIAAFCCDPIGQGERRQVLSTTGPPLRPTAEHNLVGVAPVLLGRNLATYMIWDGIRAIDYLCSRSEIDPRRIGCTGNSGGGNRTSYLMALDDRIQCAAPCCFITTTKHKNDWRGPGDMEQNIHGQIAYGMDHADYLLMRAPKPTLICSATQDFVPIDGAWESFRDAKRWYTRLGFAERVDLIEADESHGFSEPLRVGATRWMRRWLLNQDDAITETLPDVASALQLQCSPTGQILQMDSSRSVFELNIEAETRFAAERKQQWNENNAPSMLVQVRKLAGIANLENVPMIRPEAAGRIERKHYAIEKLILHAEEGIVLPALLFRPNIESGDLYLYVHGKGKRTDSGSAGPIEDLVLAGHTVLAVDIRGCGETQAEPNNRDAGVLGVNAREVTIAYMLGKSFLGMRTEDIMSCARYLKTTTDKARPLHLIAIGEAGPPALHAAALNRDLFASLTLRHSLTSWSNVVHATTLKNQLVNVVHGALKTYDLPNLIESLPTAKVRVEHPVDAAGRPVL